MSLKLAPRVAAIKPSPTLALNAKAKALAAKGADVISFAAGEPDFDTPSFIKKAAVEALDSGFTKYTATPGIPELRAAIADKLKRENGLEFGVEQIIASVGAKHSLYNVFQALLGEGDQVVVFAPYWVSYPDMVLLAGGEPVIVETSEENGYAPDPAALKKALGPRVKAVILNSPSNPTGAVLSEAQLRGIAEVLRAHHCLVVTDDIYEKLLYLDRPFQNIANVAPELKERTVVVNGFSKAFSMTGWRLGYAAGPKELVAAMQMVQDQSTSNPASIVQKGGVAALRGPRDEMQAMVREFKARRDLIVSGLNAIEGIRCRTPEGAFYAFPDVRRLLEGRYKGERIGTSLRLSEILLDDFQIAAVPGQPFGAEGHLRLSFATSRPAIEKGLDRLRKLVSQLG
jgi:aspartate aminotransferase